MEIDGKEEYKQNRVMVGNSPHKLIRLAIKGYKNKLKEKEEEKQKEEKDLFDINKVDWKGLDK